jgi:hypothetical protein
MKIRRREEVEGGGREEVGEGHMQLDAANDMGKHASSHKRQSMMHCRKHWMELCRKDVVGADWVVMGVDVGWMGMSYTKKFDLGGASR